MAPTIINIKRENVTRISFEFFKVADGWKVPRTRRDQESGYIARAVFVYRMREERILRSRPKADGTFAIARVLRSDTRQGFALSGDIEQFKRYGSGPSALCLTIFMAMTPKMVEAKRGGRSWTGKTCKRPFDMIRSGRAKVYHSDGFNVCTMGGKVVAQWPS